MRALVALIAVGLAMGACTAGAETTSSTAAATSENPVLGPCHPTNTREDCTLVVVLMDEPVDLAGAETFANEHSAYLNVLYRVDPVCVAKDFPIMGGFDLGETPSRRTYWEAEERMDRIADAIGADLVPPPTIGGFDVVIDQRMSDEWRLAQMPGVLFDSLGLWIDAPGATALEAEYKVDLPEFSRYDHSQGRGEIVVRGSYEPPAVSTSGESDDCQRVP